MFGEINTSKFRDLEKYRNSLKKQSVNVLKVPLWDTL